MQLVGIIAMMYTNDLVPIAPAQNTHSKGEIFVSPKCSKVERRPGRVETGSGTDFEDFAANRLLS